MEISNKDFVLFVLGMLLLIHYFTIYLLLLKKGPIKQSTQYN